MCISCWDADKKAEMLKQGDPCTGEDLLIMSYDELKYNLTQEWISSKKTSYRVYAESVPERPSDSISFNAKGPGGSDMIQVKFI